METLEHTIIYTFRKIDPSKKYSQFTYFEAKDFMQAFFGCSNGEIYKIDGSFFQVRIGEALASRRIENNVIVKDGRKIIQEFHA